MTPQEWRLYEDPQAQRAALELDHGLSRALIELRLIFRHFPSLSPAVWAEQIDRVWRRHVQPTQRRWAAAGANDGDCQEIALEELRIEAACCCGLDESFEHLFRRGR